MLAEMPNVYTDRRGLYEIGRQPRVARDFFIKFQDRILFGKDSFQPEEYPYYWRVFETRDGCRLYRDYHAYWETLRHRASGFCLEALLSERLEAHTGVPRTGWPR